MDVTSAQAESGVELLGRDDELAQLYAMFDGIGQRGGSIVVRGEAGIGKSALLEAASARITIYPDSAHGFLFQHHEAFAADVSAFLRASGERGVVSR
jgi:AAA ATPase domain